MEITQFGAESTVKGIRAKLLKQLAEYDTLVEILNGNEGLTYRSEWIRSNIDTMSYTGRFVIMQGRKELITVSAELKKVIDLYGIKVKP